MHRPPGYHRPRRQPSIYSGLQYYHVRPILRRRRRTLLLANPLREPPPAYQRALEGSRRVDALVAAVGAAQMASLRRGQAGPGGHYGVAAAALHDGPAEPASFW